MKMNSLYGTIVLASLALVSCKKEEEVTPTVDPNKQIIIPRVAPIPSGMNTAQQPQQVQQTITPEQMQQMQMQQQIQMQQQKTAQVVTKPGMNPPHGQPGHRCDIAVGAPLNSKPNPAAPKAGSGEAQKITLTPNQTGTPAAPASATPAILNPDGAATATAPGMNPPHGQPGHVCGTPVGSPLPK